MAIFNWGIYAGIGLAFPVGRYVTEMNIGGLVSKNQIFSNFHHIDDYITRIKHFKLNQSLNQQSLNQSSHLGQIMYYADLTL